MEVDELVVRIINGEYQTKEELAYALKLFKNMNGTEINEYKEKTLTDLDYVSDVITVNEKKYISLDSVKDIINR